MNPIARGTIRFDLTRHIDHLGAIDQAARFEVRAWVRKDTDFGALIDIGAAQHVGNDIVTWLAEVTLYAVAIDVIGDNPETVAQLLRDLPPAQRIARSWHDAA